MSGAQRPYLLIDFDCSELTFQINEAKCDFAFVSDVDNRALSLELKNGDLDASEVVKQLRAGARRLENMVASVRPVKFKPVAVIGGKIHRSEVDKLQRKKNRIAFRKRLYEIVVLRCGSPISKVF